jgi:hypothetical protein
MPALQSLFTRDRAVALGIFTFTLLVFLFSRVHQVTDSRYSMLVSDSLIKHGSFTLDAYNLPRYAPEWRGYYFSDGPVYQIEVAGGHLYHHLPPGTPVLSAPYVGVLKMFGVSAANSDGTYNEQGEVRIEASLAALLMALLAAIFFVTARLVLPMSWSVVVALGGALGTQVYSTASRALWSETWGILLVGIVIYLLLRHETGKRPLNPILFATLLAGTYFVRPTFAIHIIAISAYLLIFHRRLFLRYALTGAAWAALFVLYSWSHFNRPLPSYYRANRLLFDQFWIALVGNLISPARGLLVYVPVILFVTYLLVRYRREVRHPRVVWLSLSIIVAQLLAVSGFDHWWGGHSFGPRMMTGVAPWLVLLGILGIDAMLRARESKDEKHRSSSLAWRLQLALGGVLLLLSVIINTLGATSHATWLWNLRPQEIDRHPERLWDWRQPQFLAKYLPYPPPRSFPQIVLGRIETNSPAAENYLWYGWMQDATQQTWMDNSAAMIFSATADRDYVLRLNLAPFIVPGKLNQQRLNLRLNDQPLITLVLTNPEAETIEVSLPQRLLRDKNVLKLDAPDAQSPQKLGAGDDPRPRGVNVKWFEFAADGFEVLAALDCPRKRTN